MPLSFLIDAAVGGSVMYLSEIIIFFSAKDRSLNDQANNEDYVILFLDNP